MKPGAYEKKKVTFCTSDLSQVVGIDALCTQTQIGDRIHSQNILLWESYKRCVKTFAFKQQMIMIMMAQTSKDLTQTKTWSTHGESLHTKLSPFH